LNPRISMITLGVQNIDKAVKFYKDGLGFPKLDSPPQVAFFKLNGSWLGLYNKNDLAKDASVSPQGEGFNNFTLSHNVKSEKEVEEVYLQALAAGATSVKSPQKTSWGGFHGYFKDLDEHLWEIAYNPFFWIGPEIKKDMSI